MSDLYKRWELVAEEIAVKKLTDWKSHPSVTYMLEHELVLAAQMYIDVLRTEFTNETIQRLADLNDYHGGAKKQLIKGINTSPSSIRYIRHSYDVCKHIISKGLNDVTLIEIGGGYGGLALIMSEVAPLLGIRIQKYIIYDLPSIQKLQKYYLSLHTLPMVIEWKDCGTFGADVSSDSTNVLVSCYCISEVPNEIRKQYLHNLLPKIKAAYFVWNWGSKEDLPPDRDERPEIPDTSGGKANKIIRL